jgi:DNA-binding CsgD family transcriptional regulator
MSVSNGFDGSKQVDPERPAAEHPGSALLSNDTWPRIQVALGLSPRELQVIQGIFQDDKEASIAQDLGISPHTVNTYLQRLYAKLRVCSRSQLIVRVVAEYLSSKKVRLPD